ncbi:SMI1/KNR4 family protein [Symmachiella dynata]|uniref:SMI1/KNR4 family protein n=1 Tax=Symmachiella dynata TaxID=2527995 RepID=UPI00118906AF|nr:SMI1/KNR4 family protein [Symmachiella dynata]QDT47607.1 hypothetical protein Pan258_16430 [Symmachiella dynata]|tara:strand:- start:323 stop:955 length:633 start_codon:yes stop_codon:yes gene_type:complete
MQWFHRTIELLTKHFDNVRLRAPITEDEIIGLQFQRSTAAEELKYFYTQTNGLAVGLHDSVVGLIFEFEESQKLLSLISHRDGAYQLLPVRGDGCGDYDCLVIGGGIAEGAVVFYDHEVNEAPSHLLAGSFASYFQLWADYLTTKYQANGEIDQRYVAPKLEAWPWLGEPQRRHPWPFDEAWLKVNDEKAAILLEDAATRSWLNRQNDLT